MVNFLKPNRWKAVIFVLVFTVGIYAIFNAVSWMSYFEKPISYTILTSVFLVVLYIFDIFPSGSGLFALIVLLILFLLSLFYWYLLSCLIYLLFTAIKRKIIR